MIFRKLLIIFILLSVVPAALFYFLIPSEFHGVLILSLFLSLVLVVSCALFAAKRIARPLSQVADGARSLSKGDLNVRFKIKSKDELGQLAGAINEMTTKLREQREREMLISRLKSEFISTAAHQLRTPLSSVKWILKTLLDGDAGSLSVEHKDLISKSYIANERMITLVNDLLNVGRIEEGRFGFNFSEADYARVIEEAVESFQAEAKRKKVKLDLNIKDKDLSLSLDPIRLKMAISNLLDNAVRYTPEGGRIIISVQKQAGKVETRIEDSGVGIPKKQQDRVFTKFFRGNNVIRMQTEGTGLGLYLVKNIVEKHGGKIWFESEEGKGTTFIFSLPHD